MCIRDRALCDTVLGEGTYDVLETFVGKDLEYKEYEPLFDYAVATCEKQHKKAFYIVCDNYVTLTDGTGVVPVSYTHLKRMISGLESRSLPRETRVF